MIETTGSIARKYGVSRDQVQHVMRTKNIQAPRAGTYRIITPDAERQIAEVLRQRRQQQRGE